MATAGGAMAGTNVHLIGNTEYNNSKMTLQGNYNAKSQRRWVAVVPWEAQAGGRLELEGSRKYK